MEGVKCPFCCEDRFTHQQLLKYHLLSLTTNIPCPFCGILCADIHSLIVHLDNMCIDKDEQVEKPIQDDEMIVVYSDDIKQEPVNVTGEYDNLVNQEDYQNDEKATNVEIDAETRVKEEFMEFNDDPTEVAGQPSDNEFQEESENEFQEESENEFQEESENEFQEESENEFQEESENEFHEESENEFQEGSDLIYYCSGCNINFSSILDHVNYHHEGQPVLLDL